MGNDDVCYCETCKHQEASECVQKFKCTCCVEADTIRLKHPVLTGEAEDARDAENEEMEKEYFAEADPDVL